MEQVEQEQILVQVMDVLVPHVQFSLVVVLVGNVVVLQVMQVE